MMVYNDGQRYSAMVNWMVHSGESIWMMVTDGWWLHCDAQEIVEIRSAQVIWSNGNLKNPWNQLVGAFKHHICSPILGMVGWPANIFGMACGSHQPVNHRYPFENIRGFPRRWDFPPIRGGLRCSVGWSVTRVKWLEVARREFFKLIIPQPSSTMINRH